MRKHALVLMFCCAVLLGAATAQEETSEAYPDPARFEEAIKAFEAADAEEAPPEGAIVGIGSSSMRGWEDIHEDLAPLTIIHRGFGGSNMNDALHYTDRIVLPYKPRAVLLYEGDNDVAQGIAPEHIAETFEAFVDKVHAALPETRIYVIAIKPSIARWEMWPKMRQANALLEERCAQDPRLHYIDVATPMLNAQGDPREDIFLEDDLHMNRGGYEIWRDTVRPVLLEGELDAETGNGKQ